MGATLSLLSVVLLMFGGLAAVRLDVKSSHGYRLLFALLLLALWMARTLVTAFAPHALPIYQDYLAPLVLLLPAAVLDFVAGLMVPHRGRMLRWRALLLYPLALLGVIGTTGWTGFSMMSVVEAPTGAIYHSATPGGDWTRVWAGTGRAVPESIHLPSSGANAAYSVTVHGEEVHRDALAEVNGDLPFPTALRSSDGGRSWERLDTASGLVANTVTAVTTLPQEPEIVLAGGVQRTDPHRFAELDRRVAAGQPNPFGIYRSRDGGRSWRQVFAFPADETWNEEVTAFAASNEIPARVYAATPLTILRSDDAGRSWRIVAGRGEEGWMPSGHRPSRPILLHGSTEESARILAITRDSGIFVSTDRGVTWQLVRQRPSGASFAHIAHVPGDGITLLVCGESGIWRYSSGSWNAMSVPRLPDVYSFSHIAVDPRDPQRILVAPVPFSGFLHSSNAGKTWNRLGGRAISSLESDGPIEITDVAFASAAPKQAYAATANVGCKTKHEPQHRHGRVLVSRDGGRRWSATTRPSSTEMAILDLAVPANRPSTVYAAGSTGLFRTDDAGTTWRKLLSVERAECKQDEACVREPVYRSVAVAPYDAQHIIVARAGKRGIMVSKNGGTSWKPAQLVDGASERDLTIHELVFSPVTRGLVYAVEYDRHSLLISKDGGLTWRIRPLSQVRRPLGLVIPKSAGDVEATYVVTDGSGLFRVSESIERFGPPVGRTVDADCANMTCVTTDPAGGVLLSLDHGRHWTVTSCRYPHAEQVHDSPRAVTIREGRPLELYAGYQDNRWLARWRISSGNLANAELLRAFSLPRDVLPDVFTAVHDIEIKRESPHSLLVGVEETRSREEPALVALPMIGEYHVRGYASLVYHLFVFVGFIVAVFLVVRNGWRNRTVRWETAFLSSSLLLLIPALQYERVSSATIAAAIQGETALTGGSAWPMPWALPVFAVLLGGLLLLLIHRYETLFVRPRRLAHELISGIHAPILVLDSSYRILALNTAAEYVFGYKEIELEGLAVDAVFARIQERDVCECDLDEYARESRSFDSVCRSRDGEQFRCVLSFSFLGAARGQKLGYIVSLTFNPDFQRIQNRFGFTKREMDVLRLLLQGMRYREIAERLCVSIPTVKSHVHHIYEKSEATNRFHLIRLVK